MLEMLRENSSLYKWGVGETWNMSKIQLLCSLLELWTSFKHGKSTFLKLCPTKKMLGIKLSFHS